MYYLNNSGHRWKTPGEMRFVLVLEDGSRKVLTADCWEAFGNFAILCYRYKGKRSKSLPSAHDGSDVRDPDAIGKNALPHIFRKECCGHCKVLGSTLYRDESSVNGPGGYRVSRMLCWDCLQKVIDSQTILAPI